MATAAAGNRDVVVPGSTAVKHLVACMRWTPCQNIVDSSRDIMVRRVACRWIQKKGIKKSLCCVPSSTASNTLALLQTATLRCNFCSSLNALCDIISRVEGGAHKGQKSAGLNLISWRALTRRVKDRNFAAENFSSVVQPEVVASWLPKETYLGQLEIFAGPVCPRHLELQPQSARRPSLRGQQRRCRKLSGRADSNIAAVRTPCVTSYPAWKERHIMGGSMHDQI